jgi:bis(5'-adenosyl)-triphosphatase
MIEEHHQAVASNVAIQDGVGAGQSVPHVHIHILPRTEDCALKGDQIYQELDVWAPRERQQVEISGVDLSKKERQDRTEEAMAEEAAIYQSLMSKI